MEIIHRIRILKCREKETLQEMQSLSVYSLGEYMMPFARCSSSDTKNDLDQWLVFLCENFIGVAISQTTIRRIPLS